MLRTVQQEKHGWTMMVQPAFDEARRDLCLCLSCRLLKPNRPDNCSAAQRMFDICQEYGLASGVTACSMYVALPEP